MAFFKRLVLCFYLLVALPKRFICFFALAVCIKKNTCYQHKNSNNPQHGVLLHFVLISPPGRLGFLFLLLLIKGQRLYLQCFLLAEQTVICLEHYLLVIIGIPVVAK